MSIHRRAYNKSTCRRAHIMSLHTVERNSRLANIIRRLMNGKCYRLVLVFQNIRNLMRHFHIAGNSLELFLRLFIVKAINNIKLE